ncbi:MAG: ABC transporter ATP-binding protein [Thermaurantimonas sp.]|uniref:ABC transporter ATP-binding protein n=1 Tax=Thermaurantimonas sp. TaxID=2681568 RepID=UPI00391945A4
MSESSYTSTALDISALRKVFRFIGPYRKEFFYGMGLVIFLSIITSARPVLIQKAIDESIITRDKTLLIQLSTLILALMVFESIAQYFYSYLANFLGQNIIKDIRASLYKRLVHFKLEFYDRTPVGNLVTRAISDIEVISEIFSEGLLVIIGDLLKVVAMLIAMFYFIDWRLNLIALSVLPFLFVATRWFQKNIKISFQQVRNEVANLNAFVQERLTGMSVVQIFGREKAEFEKFKIINARHRDANIKGIWYFSIFLPLLDLISAISIALVVSAGSWWAVSGQDISLGELTSLIMFINMIFRPLRQLADRINSLQMGIVASNRVFSLLDNIEFPESDTSTSLMPPIVGQVRFENVTFGYKADETVLHNVSFEIEAGKTLAIVGATGAGKSTIIQLLSRYYQPRAGAIYIDNIDISKVSLQSLRGQMAVVLQDVFLFSDTIYKNITLGQPYTLAEVEEAADRIGIMPFIRSLPGGWDYNVRERGATLSTGQRQLIAFLRAYLVRPKIFILDEATSNIDSQTEQMVQKAIEHITRGRTSIIIAHRLSTILHADKILVLKKGKIIEEGTHQELLKNKGYYSKLFEIQFASLTEQVSDR